MLARPLYTPAQWHSRMPWQLPTTFYLASHLHHPLSFYHKGSPQWRNSWLQPPLLHQCPNSPLSQKMMPFPRSHGEHAFGWNHFEGDPRRPPSSKQQETPPWNRALKPSCAEAFGQDSDLVKEAREAFFSKHSYNFVDEGTCNVSKIFWQMATDTELLGTSIHEIQASWMGPDELKQATYALRALPKGPKFLHAVPPSESPKVMGLMGIHDLDALCHFSGITHCPWCGKEGQNEGTMVNHLCTVHYRLGLVCKRYHDCPSIMGDTLC